MILVGEPFFCCLAGSLATRNEPDQYHGSYGHKLFVVYLNEESETRTNGSTRCLLT